MLMVLLYPSVDPTACLSNADLTTPTGYTIYFWCLQSYIILEQPKEARHSSAGYPMIFCHHCKISPYSKYFDGWYIKRKRGNYVV
jgi:hypothetical protein